MHRLNTLEHLGWVRVNVACDQGLFTGCMWYDDDDDRMVKRVQSPSSGLREGGHRGAAIGCWLLAGRSQAPGESSQRA